LIGGMHLSAVVRRRSNSFRVAPYVLISQIEDTGLCRGLRGRFRYRGQARGSRVPY
jgi:hypothetical protein